MNPYFVAIVAIIVGGWALGCLSGLLTLRSLRPDLPEPFKGWYDAQAYRRSQEYASARTRFGLAAETWSSAVALAFFLLCGFAWLEGWAQGPGLGPVPTGLAYVGALWLLTALVGLPADLYATFVLEERFGFNRTGPGAFAADKLKGLALTAAIGGPVLAGVLFLFTRFGPDAWVAVWLVVVAVVLLLQWLAPSYLLPIFNRFTPLEDGELRQAITSYLHSVGYEAQGVYVMDGSRRSSKANAFFAGFGKRKRIALYDTLIDDMQTDELVAVLAHEVGHARLGHVKRMLAVAVGKLAVFFAVLAFMLGNEGLAAAFCVDTPSVHTGLVFFGVLYGPLAAALGLGTGWLSRRHEHQADAFARKTYEEPFGAPGALARALKRLTVKNLGNLTPHPLNVVLGHSHPPVLQRLERLEQTRR